MPFVNDRFFIVKSGPGSLNFFFFFGNPACGRCIFSTCVITFLCLSSAFGDDTSRLFGSLEFKGPIKALPQWSRVIEEAPAELALLNSCVQEPPHASRAKRAWQRMLSEARGLSQQEQLRIVNMKINTWPYQPDESNYGKSDYWASPLQFLKKSGDCEDYSIAKYYLLRELGFPAEQLRIVIVKDQIRQITHAVLAVLLKDKTLILDNLSNIIVSDSKYKHYNPQYSVNEKHRWAHIKLSQSYQQSSIKE